MAQIEAGDIWEVKVYTSMVDQLAINVLHYRCRAVSGTSASDLTMAANFEDLFDDDYRALLSVKARYRGVGVHKLWPIPRTEEIFSSILQDDGTQDGDPLPRQVCGVISKRTGFSGRAMRGRVYVPFPSEDDNSPEGHPVPGYTARLTALAGEMEAPHSVGTPPNTALMDPIIYHRLDGSWTLIQNMFGTAKWGTQRRRGDYGRTNVLKP